MRSSNQDIIEAQIG